MRTKEINSLAKEVFEANGKKGFHDEEQSNETLLMLVLCELSEAVEADRKTYRKIPDIDAFRNKLYGHWSWKGYPDYIVGAAYEWHVKGCREEELADAVIRLLDLAGLRGVELNYSDNTKKYIKKPKTEPLFSEKIYKLCQYVAQPNSAKDETLPATISKAIADIEATCRIFEIDLWKHIEIKLLYNKTREHKHGKTY